MSFVAATRDISTIRQPLKREQINRLCQNAFGREMLPQTCHLIDNGKFNTSYRLAFGGNQSVILRVAPSDTALIFKHEKELLRRESTVQPILNGLSDKFPRNLFVDFSHQLIDRDYVFQNCLEGELWDDKKNDLSDEENETLWAQLGLLVRRIHAVSHHRFGPPDPAKSYDRWSEATISWINDLLEDLQCHHLPHEDAVHFLQLVEAGREHLDAVRHPRLIHGDLWQKNILFRHEGSTVEITGVLDAERAFWGDPGAEWIFSFLEIPACFWQAYGRLKASPSAVFRNLIYQGRGAIQLCLEAWRFQFDDSHFRKALLSVIERLSSFDTRISHADTPLFRRRVV